MNIRNQLICAWSSLGFAGICLVGFLLANFIPPISPDLSADEVAAIDPSEAVRSDEILATCRDSGLEITDYRGAGCFFTPFIGEAIFVNCVPYAVGYLLVRSGNPMCWGDRAERALFNAPYDLSRYADILVNFRQIRWDCRGSLLSEKNPDGWFRVCKAEFG